jgi:hypothetical protein
MGGPVAWNGFQKKWHEPQDGWKSCMEYDVESEPGDLRGDSEGGLALEMDSDDVRLS